MLDMWTERANKDSFSHVNREMYTQIVVNKTAFYTFELPIRLGLFVSGRVTSEASLKRTHDICCELGKYFQIQV